MKSTIKLVLMLVGLGFCVSGILDYNTFNARTYASGASVENFTSVQWVNYNDWRDEMDDYADSYISGSISSKRLKTYFEGAIQDGFNADLVLIQTHGREYGSGSTFRGLITDYDDSEVDTRNFRPANGEMEIIIIHACDIMSVYNENMWYGFRNMFMHGNLVIAGCYGTCYLSMYGFNTTFNELGDEIADGASTIHDAWWDALDVGYGSDKMAIFGLGRVGANNCDNRARNVSLQNRLDYYQYEFNVNEPYPNSDDDKELCGYYTTD
jgi:hypothetical protein